VRYSSTVRTDLAEQKYIQTFSKRKWGSQAPEETGKRLPQSLVSLKKRKPEETYTGFLYADLQNRYAKDLHLLNIIKIMAGPKGSKYYDIFLKQQLQLVTREDNIVINEEGFTLLTEIKKGQSIVAAAGNMGISYRKAWGLLSEIENVLGFQLVVKHRGGKAGGKTDLTAEGMELTEAYLNLKTDLEDKVHDTVKSFFNRINNIADKR